MNTNQPIKLVVTVTNSADQVIQLWHSGVQYLNLIVKSPSGKDLSAASPVVPGQRSFCTLGSNQSFTFPSFDLRSKCSLAEFGPYTVQGDVSVFSPTNTKPLLMQDVLCSPITLVVTGSSTNTVQPAAPGRP